MSVSFASDDFQIQYKDSSSILLRPVLYPTAYATHPCLLAVAPFCLGVPYQPFHLMTFAYYRLCSVCRYLCIGSSQIDLRQLNLALILLFVSWNQNH